MIAEWLNMVDIIFVLVVLISGLAGRQQGVLYQLPQLLALLGFGILLFFLHPLAFQELSQQFPQMNETVIIWALIILQGGLAWGIFTLVSKPLEKKKETKASAQSDQMVGLLLGLFRGALVATLTIILFSVLFGVNFENRICKKSKLGTAICQNLVPQIQPYHSGKSLGAEIRNPLLERKEAEYPQ